MGKTYGYPNEKVILLGQIHPMPMPKGRRAATQIYKYITYFPADYAHQFSLRASDLIVQPAQYTTLGPGMIILNKAFLNPKLSKNLMVVALQEKTTIIGENFGLEYVGAGERMVDDLHMAPVRSENLFL